MAVVCAGIKSILDLGLTLEYLETHGVPVIGHGTERLPAFFSRDSDFGVDARLDTLAEIAAVMRARWSLGLPGRPEGGLVIANPVPTEHALPRGDIDAAIDAALAEATTRGIAGKHTTPFLLQRVNELTGGHSLEANIALIKANARLAAAIALAYSDLDADLDTLTG